MLYVSRYEAAIAVSTIFYLLNCHSLPISMLYVSRYEAAIAVSTIFYLLNCHSLPISMLYVSRYEAAIAVTTIFLFSERTSSLYQKVKLKNKSPQEVCFLGIKEEKRCTFSIHKNTDCLLMNTSTKHEKYVNKKIRAYWWCLFERILLPYRLNHRGFL